MATATTFDTFPTACEDLCKHIVDAIVKQHHVTVILTFFTGTRNRVIKTGDTARPYIEQGSDLDAVAQALHVSLVSMAMDNGTLVEANLKVGDGDKYLNTRNYYFNYLLCVDVNHSGLNTTSVLYEYTLFESVQEIGFDE